MNNLKNNWRDGLCALRHMLKNPLDAPDGEVQVEIIGNDVFMSKKNVQHFDTR